jgi:predicted nuclease with TOPRIM domain
MPGLRKRNFIITPAVKQKIVEIIDKRIREAHITREDFSELKSIVKELAEEQKKLAEAQRGSEERLTRLETTVAELAEAQRGSEERLTRLETTVAELAEAQKKTEASIQALTKELRNTRRDLGGLSRTLGYGFENEAYRMVPKVLREKYGIEIKERFVRMEIGGKEVNLFGRGVRDGKEVLIVGEVKLRMDRARDVFGDLDKKVSAVLSEYPGVEIVKVLVTHYITGGLLKKAEEQGIIIIQSYEW